MPIYRAEELPDLGECTAISRGVPVLPSGMEKEEEGVSTPLAHIKTYTHAVCARFVARARSFAIGSYGGRLCNVFHWTKIRARFF